MSVYTDMKYAIDYYRNAYFSRWPNGGDPNSRMDSIETTIDGNWYNSNNCSKAATKIRYVSPPWATVSPTKDEIEKIEADRIEQIATDIKDGLRCEGCVNSCEAACSGDCGSGCTGCHGCSSSCGSGCANGCGGGCSGRCGGGCSSGCKGKCTSSCGSGCANGCEGGCYHNCTGSCDEGCSTGCDGCKNGCNGKCKPGCGGKCESSCKGQTQKEAEKPKEEDKKK